MGSKLLYSCLGVIAGLIIGYFVLPKSPDIKVITETRVVTKTVQVAKNTVTEREIIKYKDGKEVIKEKIVDRDVIKEVETVKEKIVDKTVNYTTGLGVGVNILNLNEPCAAGEIQLIGPFWINNLTTLNVKTWEVNSFIFVSMRF